ncbi:MAG: aminoacyl-tRNA hydrolase [Firmicutes bacterium]|nr:aminoacyl-tRNA hydrolase [Bacillota bacterium]
MPEHAWNEGWVLVPLGNPGAEYQDTRHNLGRLLLQRWMADRELAPAPAQRFPSGTLYPLMPRLQALVPRTYMNHSGQVCLQAVEAGLDPQRLVVLCDDKDLPLGLGRLRREGSHGGHNGLRSILESLDRTDIARLRLGIGPFERPLGDFVLEPWSDDEWERIDRLDAPFARFLELLTGAESLDSLVPDVNPASYWMQEKQM